MANPETIKLLGNGKAYIICCKTEISHRYGYDHDRFFVTILFSKEEADKLCDIFSDLNEFLRNIDDDHDDIDSEIEKYLSDKEQYKEVYERYIEHANHDYFTCYKCEFHAEEIEIH